MKKVLVVDDNHDILNVISIILETEGYQVKCCDNGKDVKDTVLFYHPDLILLDIMLGEMDGRELCKELKDSFQTNHIPIIMISASHTLLNSKEKDCNADDFIAKPFDLSHLVEKVDSYVN